MSLLGSFNDLLTGNPPGTADAASAADDAANAQLATLNAQAAQNIAATQGTTAAQAYTNQVGADYSTDAEDPNSLQAAADETLSGVVGAAQAATNPVQVLTTGLQWEGQQVGNIAGSVAGAAGNAASDAFWAAVKKFFSGASIGTWVLLVLIVWLFWYFGGIQRRGRAVFG